MKSYMNPWHLDKDLRELPTKYNIGVVGNPVTSVSSGKFLMKFLKILTPISNSILVINDGFPAHCDSKVHVINATTIVNVLGNRNRSFLARCISFIVAELASTFSILKFFRHIDIVIVLPTTAILPIFASKLRRMRTFLMAAQDVTIPIVNKNVEQSLSSSFLHILKRLAFLFSDNIIIESQSVIDSLGLRIWRDKIVIAPIYVNLAFYTRKRNIKDRNNIVGYVGNLVKRKGVEEFTRAIPQVLKKRQDVVFIIGGTGPFFNSLKKFVNCHQLSIKVTFKGRIPEEDLPTCLNELKLLVLPSYSEGLPNIVLEAMACGTPVLATPVGAIPDVIKDGENGFIMESNSPECISRNIVRVLGFENLRKISKNARRFVEEKYCYEAAVERYWKLLNKI